MPLSAAIKETLPAEQNITIAQGATFLESIEATSAPLVYENFTGCTATGKIRATFGGTLIETFTCTIPVPTNGTIFFQLTPTQTAALTGTFPDTSTRVAVIGVFDVEITDGTDVVRVLQGTASLSREVTTP